MAKTLIAEAKANLHPSNIDIFYHFRAINMETYRGTSSIVLIYLFKISSFNLPYKKCMLLEADKRKCSNKYPLYKEIVKHSHYEPLLLLLRTISTNSQSQTLRRKTNNLNRVTSHQSVSCFSPIFSLIQD